MTEQQFVACTAAMAWLDDDCLTLDTETTGLGEDAEIVEITVIDHEGQPLMNTLVKPARGSIPDEVINIHGITNEMVAAAPLWADINDEFMRLIAGRTVVMYNAAYDSRLIMQSQLANGLEADPMTGTHIVCAMHGYAQMMGEYDYKRGKPNKRFKLVDAAAHVGVTNQGAHRALADCLMTLGVVKAMASVAEEEARIGAGW